MFVFQCMYSHQTSSTVFCDLLDLKEVALTLILRQLVTNQRRKAEEVKKEMQKWRIESWVIFILFFQLKFEAQKLYEGSVHFYVQVMGTSIIISITVWWEAQTRALNP